MKFRLFFYFTCRIVIARALGFCLWPRCSSSSSACTKLARNDRVVGAILNLLSWAVILCLEICVVVASMRRFGRPVGNTDSLAFMYSHNDVIGNHENGITSNNSVHFNDMVSIENVELFAVENATNHWTDKYDLVQEQKVPVLRRANSFYMSIKSSREIDLKNDNIRLVFEFGQYPSLPKGTCAVVQVTEKLRLDNPPTMWDVIVHSYSGQTLILKVQISSKAPVGVWKCRIESGRKGESLTKSNTYVCKKPIYILFNPYSKDDSVYYPNEPELQEYVQNDVGKVWKGSFKQFEGRHWIFGQFESVVLPACCFILDQSGLRSDKRGSPIRVSRTISAMVNSVDDNGVLRGKWSAPYDDGTAPWEWTGSEPILQSYLESRGKPVNYGQCWVFSAVVVTICRALGIPCRSVTNYVSAHDTNHSLTVDKFFSEEGVELSAKNNPEFGNDSIWNFHVWNEVWMARPDLPVGYGGWQAIDSTPQESSDGQYQCGPAPVEAIRRGEIGFSFDCGFLFAEVNADICHFVKDPESPWGFTRTQINSYHVGRLVLTKAANYYDPDGDNDAEDITWQYKENEGSYQERMAVYKAVSHVDKTKRYYKIPGKGQEDVRMELVELDRVAYGDAYKARVLLENLSMQDRTIKVIMSSSSVFYFGATAYPISRAEGEFVLKPGQKDTLALTVWPSDYMGKLVDYCMVKIYSLIKVKETNQTWSDEDDFVLEKPKLTVEIDGTLKHGRLGEVTVSFRNPLSVALTKCKVSLKASGVMYEIREMTRDVPANAHFAHKFLVTPRKSGKVSFVATFSSEEIIDLYGTATATIV